MTSALVRSVPIMGTIVTIELPRLRLQVDTPEDEAPTTDANRAIERAFKRFREIERVCNRFDPSSELRRLTETPGVPVVPNALLFVALDFALELANDTHGAFDPTVGRRMEERGFNRDYRTGAAIESSGSAEAGVSYRDVHLDHASQSVTIERPLTLDLGAFAKGLAIDLAAKELSAFANFAIDAGGDLYVAGHNGAGSLWGIGIRHPRRDREAITRLRLSNAAICTSGDYERQSAEFGHHIIDPRTTPGLKTRDSEPSELASATVIAPTAMLADAMATAAFVLGPIEGIRFLERHGFDGLMYSPTLERFETAGIAEIEDRG